MSANKIALGFVQRFSLTQLKQAPAEAKLHKWLIYAKVFNEPICSTN